MGDACRALDYPIVSGNVSLYNESKATGGGSAILPTPAIGGVGLLDDVGKMATIAFKDDAHKIILIGSDSRAIPEMGQSTWLNVCHGRQDGPVPKVDLAAERKHGEFVRKLVEMGRVTAVHDVSDGGILVAIAEMALAGNVGARLEISAFENAVDREKYRHTWSLFAEESGALYRHRKIRQRRHRKARRRSGRPRLLHWLDRGRKHRAVSRRGGSLS